MAVLLGGPSPSGSQLTATTYVLDPTDRIVAVDEAWIAFAQANGAAALAQRVLGQSLWSFIADATVRELYRTILARVRATGRAVTLPFRCDSPIVRRYMALTVSPAEGPAGTLAFRATPLREELQPAAVAPVYVEIPGREGAAGAVTAAAGHRTAELLTICSVCKRIDLGGWIEIADAVARDPELLSEPVRALSHGLCPVCRDQMLAALP